MNNERSIEEITADLNAWHSGMSNFAECLVWFQHIENTLGICICAFGAIDEEIGQIITAEMSFRAKVSVLGALASNASGQEDLHEDIKDLLNRVRWAEQERNRLVHSIWDLCDKKPGTIRREKRVIRKNKHRVDEENFDPEDFEELQGLFEGINTDLIYLFSEHYPDLEDRLHY
jgi:hypothetical protein